SKLIYHRSDFVFNDTATTDIYTLSLHDALPILLRYFQRQNDRVLRISNFNGMSSEKDVSLTQIREGDYCITVNPLAYWINRDARSEEHTSELQSRGQLVCRLLLEKKKTFNSNIT